MARRGDDWTAGRTDRRRHGLKAVDTAAVPRSVQGVAFDQYVFDGRALARADGATLMRARATDGTLVAVAGIPWPEMPVEWAALQSRRGPDLLGFAGDEMEPVGHRTFDDRFAVDCDDVSLFRRVFRTTLRDRLVGFDDHHGPLIILFDRPEPPMRRRATDPPPGEGTEPGDTPLVFVARQAADDDAVAETLNVAIDLVEDVRTNARG